MPITIIAIFPSRDIALQGIDEIRQLELIDINRAAVVAKATSGETVLVDDEVQPADGRKVGIRMGALTSALGVAQLGAFALPGIGPIIAIGAGMVFGGMIGGATGQFAAALIHLGFRRDQIAALSDHLQDNEVALIIQLQDRDLLPQLRTQLATFEVEIILSEQPNVANFKRLPPNRE